MAITPRQRQAWLCSCLSDTLDLGPLVQNVIIKVLCNEPWQHNVLAVAVEASLWYGSHLFNLWHSRTQAELQTRLVSLRSRAATLLKASFQLSQQMSADVSSSKLKDKALLCCGITGDSCSSFTFWWGGERSRDEACKNAAGSCWWWEIDV